MAEEHRAAPLEPGSVFAGYRIERTVGVGGMGTVYRATQLALDRVVALKVISTELATDSTFQNRFNRESRVAAALEHPNVVPIYEAGETDGLLYLAMRYVEGEDLRTRVEREGRFDALTVSPVIAQVAAALDQAHAHGMVHRDVKPGNILLEESGRVFLTDFGLVKQFGAHEGALTQTGTFVGTLDYVAPEQIQGGAVDARVDIYALGGVLFFALTGEEPYRRDNAMAVLWAHVSEPPPSVSELAPVPPALDAVIRRAMAKEPNERYASAGELARAVAAAAAGDPLPGALPSVAPELGAAGVSAQDTAITAIPGGTPQHTEPQPAPPPAPFPPPAEPSPPPAPTLEPSGPRRPAEWRIRLRDDFRYVHHPLAGDRGEVDLLGHEDAVQSLAERILHSDGGSFLITGFRGVGKTTVVEQVLTRLREVDQRELLDVKLNVARPRSIEQLMFEIIRRLFERLDERDVLERLDDEVRRELLLAYMRTSLSFNETRTDAAQRDRRMSLGLPDALSGMFSAGFELSRTTSEELATQAAFLAYTDADVEHDFLRIVRGLQKQPRSQPPAPGRRWPWSPPASTSSERVAWRGRLVVVIDELDKLTATPEGRTSLDQLLNGLKNLLTAPGVHFLFVGGGDLHTAWLLDTRRGNSVFESVFGWQLYVPCLRGATRRMLDSVVAQDARDHPKLETLHDYLEYKARGVPRLLRTELNSFVRWESGHPEIVIGGPDLARVEFYADLERTLRAFLRGDGDQPLFSVPIDEDRWRLGAYYLTDWILRTRGGSFTVEEVVGSFEATAIDPELTLSEGKVGRLLEHLVAHEKLRVRGGPGETFYGDVPEAQEPVYRVNEDLDVKLSAFARVNESERADLARPVGENGEPRAVQPWVDTGAGQIVLDRYELLEELDRGGSGRVYRAYDRQERRVVATKLLDVPSLVANEVLKGRFLRKGTLAKRLEHPNLVRTHEVFADDEGRTLGIVMDYVDGIPLGQLVSQAKLPAHDAVALIVPLVRALEYLHTAGLARLDLKPSRVMLVHDRRPIILDLGLIKQVHEEATHQTLTGAGVQLGTPLYAAPEQLMGQPVDIRADICSVGLILFEMIAGRRARGGDSLTTALVQATREDVDCSALPASPELREVVRRCVARNPDERFEAPSVLLTALAGTPEAAQTVPAAAAHA